MLLHMLAFTMLGAASADVRVRREIRSISKEQRDRVFAGLEVMRATPQSVGEEKFGPLYRSYQSITMQHIYAAIDNRCDQGHISAGFFTYHRALVLAVEESLLAIDATIDALPYWDYGLDLALDDPSTSPVWGDDFFGEAAGDEADGWQIRTGPWKDWTVDAATWFDGPPRYDIGSQTWVNGTTGNAYGFLRGLTNQNPAPRLTRQHSVCGDALPWFGGGVNGSTWSNCVAEPTFLAFWDCMDAGINGPHPMAHIWLGGAWGAVDGNCTKKQLDTATALIVAGCLNVPDCTGVALEECVLVRNATNCARMREKGATCQRYGGGGPRPDYGADAPCKECPECADGQFGAVGDFWDGSTSTNDPIFWFHHPNMDRALRAWQATAPSPPFYDFPTRGFCPGHNLGDVISSTFPFRGRLLGLDGDLADAPVTNAMLFNFTRPGQIYTYDRLRS